MRRTFVAWAVALACLLALTGCGSSSAETKPAAPAPAPAAATETKAPEKAAPAEKKLPDAKNKVGDTVALAGVKLTVNSVRLTDKNGDNAAPEGYIFLIVNATVENTSKAVFRSNPLVQAIARAGNGVSFDTSAHSDLKGSLNGEVAPGAKITGEIAFRVPKATKGIRLEYTPDLLKTDDMASVALGDTP